MQRDWWYLVFAFESRAVNRTFDGSYPSGHAGRHHISFFRNIYSYIHFKFQLHNFSFWIRSFPNSLLCLEYFILFLWYIPEQVSVAVLLNNFIGAANDMEVGLNLNVHAKNWGLARGAEGRGRKSVYDWHNSILTVDSRMSWKIHGHMLSGFFSAAYVTLRHLRVLCAFLSQLALCFSWLFQV